MNIKISSLHFKADKKLEDFINEKLTKLEKLHDAIMGVDVMLKLENTDKPENKIVELRMKIKGNDLISEKSAKSFEEATDLAIDALKRQLQKNKEKERNN